MPAGPARADDAGRGGAGYVRITFPPATRARRQVEYRWEVAAIYPPVAGIAGDPRFDGFRRNWLSILQLRPDLRVLANHAGSDTAAFCYYEYADIARHSPPLAEGLGAWTWCAKAWIGSWKACRPTVCPIL